MREVNIKSEEELKKMADEEEVARGPIFRDIRRYYCEYCGICRSKKSLIARHILAEHEEKVKEKKGVDEGHEEKLNICGECGANFRKPAHLKQHMQSHSLETEVKVEHNLLMGVKHWIPI
ncbi:zinc finger protein [Striga asiatica]|uniref:Zinc finger protein n=1 Tax=Striga asiatica TaxID=4170 RepID=A0A5A7QLU5_STRAF|nr:zinc finger protein [Striga asiatica]